MATSGTSYGEVRHPIDLLSLEKYLAENIKGFKAPFNIKQFKFGQSNPTYFITDSNSVRYVLRKKPPGSLVSKTAHAVEREYAIIKALSENSNVPVPRPYCLCVDSSVLGTPFYVMEYLEGRIFTDLRFPELPSREERFACWRSAISVLATLHSLPPTLISSNLPKVPFYPRQVKSLGQVSLSQSEVEYPDGTKVGEIPEVKKLLRWYEKNMPRGGEWEGTGKIIHGDFKIDNLMYHPTEPRVIGVLDWELTSIGHPLSDLANLLLPFEVAPSTKSDPSAYELGLRGIPPSELPIPPLEDLHRLYCSSFSPPRPYPIEAWGACVSFCTFRSAVITQGINARTARGQASSEKAGQYKDLFIPLGYRAIDVIVRNGGTLDDEPEEEKLRSKL